MKQVKQQLENLLRLMHNRVNIFLLMAFAPIAVIFYYSPFDAVIPFYGFLLLIIKHQSLLTFKDANHMQRILGLATVLSSFFVYYAVVLILPRPDFYGMANYSTYLLGLFLFFFQFSALKEAFAPLFLILASASSSLVSVFLKPYLSPFANYFAHVITTILKTLGMNAFVYNFQNTPVITITSLSGKTVSGAFVYECMGVHSALIFSIILVVILFEDPSPLKTKLTFMITGLLGTFAVNILRVTMIFSADYFYGEEVGGNLHYVIGYALFSIWLACFFYVFSKRQTLRAKIASLVRKAHSTNSKLQQTDKILRNS